MINRFLCFVCRKESRVGLAKTKCSGCNRRFCDDHAGGSVRSFDKAEGVLVVEKSFCSECAFRETKFPKRSVGGFERIAYGNKGWITQAVKITPDPGAEFFKTMPVEKGELKITITDDCFIKMLKLRAADTDEIAGLAVVDENDTVVWATQCELDSKSGGHVVSDTGQATIDALLAGYNVPNAQWHTHPNMSAYFSPTDTKDQGRFVKDVLETDPTATGEMTFIVFDTIDWKVSRVKWEKGVVTGIQHGYIYLGDTKMTKPVRQWKQATPLATKVVSATPVQAYLPGVTRSVSITEQATQTPPKIVSSLEEGVIRTKWSQHDGYDDDYYDQLFTGWASIDLMIEGLDEETGEIIAVNDKFKDLTFDDTSEYFEHFGIPYGDFGALIDAAESKYGKLWDWDLRPDVEGRGDDSDPRGAAWAL